MATKKNDEMIMLGLHLLNRRFDDLKRFQKYCQAPKEVEVIETEIAIDKGVKVQKNKIVTKKLCDKIDKSLCWYDFSIDSLAAVGALGTLKPQTIAGDVFADADNIEKTLESLESLQVENNNEVKTEE